MACNCGKSAVITPSVDYYDIEGEALRCHPQSEYLGVSTTPSGVSKNGSTSRLDKAGRLFSLSRATTQWNSEYSLGGAIFKIVVSQAEYAL